MFVRARTAKNELTNICPDEMHTSAPSLKLSQKGSLICDLHVIDEASLTESHWHSDIHFIDGPNQETDQEIDKAKRQGKRVMTSSAVNRE